MRVLREPSDVAGDLLPPHYPTSTITKHPVTGARVRAQRLINPNKQYDLRAIQEKIKDNTDPSQQITVGEVKPDEILFYFPLAGTKVDGKARYFLDELKELIFSSSRQDMQPA